MRALTEIIEALVLIEGAAVVVALIVVGVLVVMARGKRAGR
jgi:hypothetical protein